jgi:uncharacterized membrane protein
VVGQGYVTVLWTGLLLIIYRSRPDLDAASPATSTRRYRRFLTLFTRAVLTLLALVDLSLPLEALRRWQVYRLSGSGAALPLVPFVVGMLILVTVAVRTGQGGSRLGAGGVAGPAAGSDRDDDRFWKGGLIYVNRGDAAVMVGARFGVGFTFNLGNPVAWLVLGGIVAGVAGLTVIGLAAGTVCSSPAIYARPRARACRARPTPAPTTVPLIRINCRSRPRSSSSWLEVCEASHRWMVPVTRPANSSWN